MSKKGYGGKMGLEIQAHAARAFKKQAERCKENGCKASKCSKTANAQEQRLRIMLGL